MEITPLDTVSPSLEVIEALRLCRLVFPAPAGPLQVSLEVAADDLVAVVAGADAGRALCRVMAGLSRPVSGRIEVGDRDVTDVPPAARRQIGYVPAGGGLLPHLTVRRNIGYGLRRRERVHDVTQDWVSDVIERLELRAMLDLRPHHLSEAQRWRAALARAAACLPEVLVLDHPGPVGGAELLPELLPLLSPDGAAGVAAVVCSADPEVLAAIPRQVRPERVGR
jgi:ABC-type sulfate/molybdate transport systems ATPase subunit